MYTKLDIKYLNFSKEKIYFVHINIKRAIIITFNIIHLVTTANTIPATIAIQTIHSTNIKTYEVNSTIL